MYSATVPKTQAVVLVAVLISATIAAYIGVVGEGVLGNLYVGILAFALGNFKAAATEAQKQSEYRHRMTGTIAQLAESYAELAREVKRNAAS